LHGEIDNVLIWPRRELRRNIVNLSNETNKAQIYCRGRVYVSLMGMKKGYVTEWKIGDYGEKEEGEQFSIRAD
jgi:hypothetical protein